MLFDIHDYISCRKYNCKQCLELQDIMFGDDFYDLHDHEQIPIELKKSDKQEKNNIPESFLGSEKYEVLLNTIYAGLGIPPEIMNKEYKLGGE